MCCWPQSKHITLKPKLGCILLEIENSVGKLLMDKQGGKGEVVSPYFDNEILEVRLPAKTKQDP
jgi:hypothetical protein